MTQPSPEDLIFIHAIRPSIGEEWHIAKEKIIARLPEGADPTLLDRYVDDSDNPGFNENSYGVMPYFYAHRSSRRLLEFYRRKLPASMKIYE